MKKRPTWQCPVCQQAGLLMINGRLATHGTALGSCPGSKGIKISPSLSAPNKTGKGK